MPTPPKTSSVEIVQAARELLEKHGVDALTMQAVAERVGVRGPSLYKHFLDREALLREVEKTVVADLGNLLTLASTSRNDRDALWEIASAYRRFASECPGAYSLLFALHSDDEAIKAARRQALAPALKRLVGWLGDPDLAFVRARVLYAFLHGFASIEAKSAFKLGGNIDDAFRAGIDLVLSKPDRKKRTANSKSKRRTR
jgi:AcrR family transcriptional regulator